MAPRAAHEQGERVQQILLAHLLTLSPDAFVDEGEAHLPRELQPLLPGSLRAALCDVAARVAHAAAVSQLACASKAARALAGAALPSPARAARAAKLAALCELLTAAHDAGVLDEPKVQDALVDLCARATATTPDAPPPAVVAAAAPDADEAAQWRAFAQAVAAELQVEPSDNERILVEAQMLAYQLVQQLLGFGGAPTVGEIDAVQQIRAARFVELLTEATEIEQEA
jgi:hypothetical protein